MELKFHSILGYPLSEKPTNKIQPMKQELELRSNPTAKVFIKLAIFGCFLMGFAYMSLLLLNNVLRALH
jgi:hypothetical protein